MRRAARLSGPERRTPQAAGRRAGGALTPAMYCGAAGLVVLGLLAGTGCTFTPGPGRHSDYPIGLDPQADASASGVVRPGRPVLYSVHLREGEYLEAHLDRPPSEARVWLFEPNADPTDPTAQAYTYSESFPDVAGQIVWEVANETGVHHLRLETLVDRPIRYQLTVTDLRPASPRDWSRHLCLPTMRRGRSHYQAGDAEEALEELEDAVALCTEGEYLSGLAHTHSVRGRVLQALGRHEEAREAFRRSVEVFVEAEDRHSEAGVLVRWADLERALTNWHEAESLLERGIAVARSAGDPVVEANAIEQYCRFYLERGDTERALEVCRQTLESWRGLGRPGDSVDALINLAYIHQYLGQLDSARAYYLLGLEIVAEHPDPRAEAVLWNNLATIEEAGGQYLDALVHYRQALGGYLRDAKLSDAAIALQNIGRIYERLGEPANALAYYRQALERVEQADDPLARIDVLHALGGLHKELGELDAARPLLEEALTLSRRADANPYLVDSLDEMGEFLLADGEPVEAVPPFTEALGLARDSENRWQEAHLLTDLASAQTALGNDDEALRLLFEAVRLSDQIGRRSTLAKAYFHIARIERGRHELQAARDAIEQAVAVADAVRPSIGSEELRTLYSGVVRPYHELHVDVLMAQHRERPEGGHDAEALRESERTRARSLLEILGETDVDLGAEVPEELLVQRSSLQYRLNAKEIERQNLLEQTPTDAGALFRVKLDLEALLTNLHEIERQIREASPRYGGLTSPPPVTVGEIQRSILDPDTALLEYMLGEERSFLWAVTKNRFETYELPARREIEPLARCLHWLIATFDAPPPASALGDEEVRCIEAGQAEYRKADSAARASEARAGRRDGMRQAYRSVALRLSDLLLGAPARDGMVRFRLALVNDGALEYVPFAALPVPGAPGTLLVQKHELVRLPSASILAFQRSQPAPNRDRALLAVVADPVYSLDDPRLEARPPRNTRDDGSAGRGVAAELPTYRRLEFSGLEADAIARFARGKGIFVARDLAASRGTVLGTDLSVYRYVHFATHGIINTENPLLSGLVLSLVDRHGNPDTSGYLRLHDIYGMDLRHTDMVVLSACETALGQEVRGEGLVGLTRGFLYAGAERVVASLWQVQDRATADLMERLYQGLLEEDRTPADALRQAQLHVLGTEGEDAVFPYYWAGFVLQGEWR